MTHFKASEQIPANRYVMEYTGEIICEHEAIKRDICNEGSYLFCLEAVDEASVEEGAPRYFLDARNEGNIARFVNHSCDPNMKVFFGERFFDFSFVWVNLPASRPRRFQIWVYRPTKLGEIAKKMGLPELFFVENLSYCLRNCGPIY